jgi:hypothetical protein
MAARLGALGGEAPMSSPAHHLRDRLVAAGVSTAATTFYGAEVPGTPDELTFVRDTPGLVPQDFLDGGVGAVVETCGVQVVVRAASEAAGEARAWAVYDALRRLNAVTLSGVSYMAVWAISPPFALGADGTGVTAAGSEGRRQWSVNFLAQRQR